MPSNIPKMKSFISKNGTRVLVLPRAMSPPPSPKPTNSSELIQKRRAEKEALRAALKMQQELNGNQRRCARPKAGSLKDRENSDPSDGEEEEVIFLSSAPETKSMMIVPKQTEKSTPPKATKGAPSRKTPANRPARSCVRERISLADAEHSADSEDEKNVLPPRLPSVMEVAKLLLELRQKALIAK